MPAPAQTPNRRRKVLRILAFLVLCFITAIALFYVVENWRGKRAMESLHRDVAARGETLDFAALVPKDVPDAENFVATPTVREWFAAKGDQALLSNRWPELHAIALKKLPSHPAKGERRVTDLGAWQRAFEAAAAGREGRVAATTNGAVAARQAPARAVLQALEVYEPVFNEFRASLPRPQARFPVEFQRDAPFSILLPHLGPVRNLARVLELRACAALAAGDNPAALNDTLLLLRLAESLKGETLLISQLVRLAMLQTAVQPVWEGIETHRWSAAELTTLQGKLDAIEFLPDLARALYMERAAGMTTIELARRSRLGDVMNALGNDDAAIAAGNRPINYAGRLLPRGWFYLEAANYGRMFDEQILMAKRQPFDPLAAVQAADQLEQSLKNMAGFSRAFIHHNAAASVLLPAIGKVSLKFAAGEMLARQAAAACAIERHRLAQGAVPETLAQLTPGSIKAVPYDHFGKKPMTYRRVPPGGYLLYSVGRNGTDDGGQPGKQIFDDHGDWVWKQR